MWFSLAKLALHAGKEVYKNRQESKILHSLAERKHLEKVIAGEIEFKNTIVQSHKGDWKDEFVLILISIPILLLAWSVFSNDPDIQMKLDLFFNRFSNLPMFYQALVVGAFSTILGVRGVSAFKKK
jgi:hypothetical protein